jgi:hypothetical protein
MVKNIGYDGSGINCGTLDNEGESSRVLTKDYSFSIIDNDLYGKFTENENTFIDYKNSFLSRKTIRYIKHFIIRSFIFGYDYAMVIRRLRRVISDNVKRFLS